jgi:hypothetical protein
LLLTLGTKVLVPVNKEELKKEKVKGGVPPGSPRNHLNSTQRER